MGRKEGKLGGVDGKAVPEVSLGDVDIWHLGRSEGERGVAMVKGRW